MSLVLRVYVGDVAAVNDGVLVGLTEYSSACPPSATHVGTATNSDGEVTTYSVPVWYVKSAPIWLRMSPLLRVNAAFSV